MRFFQQPITIFIILLLRHYHFSIFIISHKKKNFALIPLFLPVKKKTPLITKLCKEKIIKNKQEDIDDSED